MGNEKLAIKKGDRIVDYEMFPPDPGVVTIAGKSSDTVVVRWTERGYSTRIRRSEIHPATDPDRGYRLEPSNG